MAGNEIGRWSNRATKLTLTGVFLGSIAVFSTRILGRGEDFDVRPFDLLLLGLSSFRTGRIVAYERVAEPLRAPFTKTVPDTTGVGEAVVAKGHGVRKALGELVSCPICFGTWVAAGLVYGLHIAPRPTRVFLAIQSAVGLAEVIYGLTEALSWAGRAERRESAE